MSITNFFSWTCSILSRTASSVFVFAMDFLLCVSCLASPASDFTRTIIEKSPSEELSRQIRSAFTQAAEITVKYLPNAYMGPTFSQKESLGSQWIYSFSYRCPVTCQDHATDVQAFFASGLRIDGDCPDPYYALVELTGEEKAVSRFFVHQSGHCFTVSDESYYTEEDFSRFLKAAQLYPSFVK